MNNGKCECGGYIVLESGMVGGRTQIWRCNICKQAYFRNIFDMHLFKTLKELEAVNEF
jgi:hypothetical protein